MTPGDGRIEVGIYTVMLKSLSWNIHLELCKARSCILYDTYGIEMVNFVMIQ